MWRTIQQAIGAETGKPFEIKRRQAVGGGCINAAYLVEGPARAYFVKVSDHGGTEMFAAEAAGLHEMGATATVRVPTPVCWGEADGAAFLVLEYLDLDGSADAGARLGRDLARLHRVHRDYYGWHRDNTIGSTPQPNTPSASWLEFWREHRMAFQLRLAAHNGYTGRLQSSGERLLARLDPLFAGYIPAPSLLHGDLWSGNYAVTREGQPVIFDPACYYGDREADVAMTELFGGFPQSFYRAYEEAYPLEPGYQTRKTLYNLYHVLNHLNLFGAGYLSQAERMIGQLLSQT